MEKFRQKTFKMIQFEANLFQEASIRIYDHRHFNNIFSPKSFDCKNSKLSELLHEVQST